VFFTVPYDLRYTFSNCRFTFVFSAVVRNTADRLDVRRLEFDTFCSARAPPNNYRGTVFRNLRHFAYALAGTIAVGPAVSGFTRRTKTALNFRRNRPYEISGRFHPVHVHFITKLPNTIVSVSRRVVTMKTSRSYG